MYEIANDKHKVIAVILFEPRTNEEEEERATNNKQQQQQEQPAIFDCLRSLQSTAQSSRGLISS